MISHWTWLRPPVTGAAAEDRGASEERAAGDGSPGRAAMRGRFVPPRCTLAQPHTMITSLAPVTAAAPSPGRAEDVDAAVGEDRPVADAAIELLHEGQHVDR